MGLVVERYMSLQNVLDTVLKGGVFSEFIKNLFIELGFRFYGCGCGCVPTYCSIHVDTTGQLYGVSFGFYVGSGSAL